MQQLDDDDTAAVREKSLKKPSTAEPVLAEQQRQHLDQFVLMPINLSGTLWVCFVANGTSKKIHLYDSMDSTMYRKHSTTIGAENVAALPETYYKITYGDSCGLIVYFQQWKTMPVEAPMDVSKSGITKLR
ncbi:hypothetical protein GN244_ATG04229 [Phytophthora infestans]|uniref:Uncharacterized protein n=1 Tax=Phytophthora infestans TaxID=4787 RepID=A0A833T4V0_PHYIN|nr:hypothetical protein GN244_ATG04229 [Phytophthora infestans]